MSNYRARVTYIDYEGRSDGDSIKKIINQMKPRQLIIVHGPPEASQDLAECCRAFGGKDIKVYMPKLHETVDATSETHIYQVNMLVVDSGEVDVAVAHQPACVRRWVQLPA